AAASSWWLADEVMGLKEWTGGAMIIAASLFSGHLEQPAALPEEEPA
ncbi:MAG TPA: EamA/RhaT family transporter, partial [Methyloversatilis sp.]